jgi:hypothetical protein
VEPEARRHQAPRCLRQDRRLLYVFGLSFDLKMRLTL